MNKKKLLFITPQLCYPAVNGGMIKTQKMLEALAVKYEVEVVVLSIINSKTLEYYNRLNVIIKNYFLISEERSKRNVKNFILSIFARVPISVFRVWNADCKEYVRKKSRDFEVIFCDHFTTFQYVDPNDYDKLILHQHNAEYQIWRRMVRESWTSPLAPFILYESIRIANYERIICKSCAKVLCVTGADRTSLLLLKPKAARIEIIPSGGDEDLSNLPPICVMENGLNLVYVGTLTWQANIDGLIWFMRECWPKVIKEHPSAQINIIGKVNSRKLIDLVNATSGANILGFVENVEPYYKLSRGFVAPIFYGAGVKIKNVNAMLRGLPLITTTVGAEGMPIEPDKHFFCADNPDQFVDKIKFIFSRDAKVQEVANLGRTRAVQEYSWSEIEKKLTKSVETLFDDN